MTIFSAARSLRHLAIARLGDGARSVSLRSLGRRFPVAVVASIALLLCLAHAASSQVVRGGRGRGVTINAPGVHIQVGPILRRGGLGPRVLIPRPATSPRRFSLPPETGPTPTPATPDAAGRAASPRDASAPTLDFPQPTNGSGEDAFDLSHDLSSLSDADLLNELARSSQALHERLAKLTTGSGWQRYLQLSEEALPPPSPSGEVRLGMSALQSTLTHFDSTSENEAYEKISSLEEFQRCHAALAATVARFAPAEEVPPPRPIAPAAIGANSFGSTSLTNGAEPSDSKTPLSSARPAYPAPALEKEATKGAQFPVQPGGERSILKR
ncbi:MAG: hypothetical protein KDA61_00840 [Planctomycetales bacterium]|nr:hypothetical protein [Planctomycetales bacterium]